jgi:hypothetical protein
LQTGEWFDSIVAFSKIKNKKNTTNLRNISSPVEKKTLKDDEFHNFLTKIQLD